jgi:hypothetical protein
VSIVRKNARLFRVDAAKLVAVEKLSRRQAVTLGMMRALVEG